MTTCVLEPRQVVPRPLGRLAHAVLVRRQLRRIFDYREFAVRRPLRVYSILLKCWTSSSRTYPI